MRALFRGHLFNSVLEIGCGNGALFNLLGFDKASGYVGVDFSSKMLAAFRSRFPHTRLVQADGADFRSCERVDLVFSSHVAQYWDRDQLERHVRNAAAQVGDSGMVVIAGIPWARMRWAFARGDLVGGRFTGSGRRSVPRSAAAYLLEQVRPDIGHWYDLDDLAGLAAAAGLGASFRGSGYYPYRFHAILRPASAAQQTSGTAGPDGD